MTYYYTYGKKICISFDWHNDRHYRNLLAAWLKNENNPVDFEDLTPRAIDTDDVSRVKGVLTTRINAATHTLVIVGANANDIHADWIEIGDRNWIWWEINKSKEAGNKLIGVKLDQSYVSPTPLLNSGTRWAYYTMDSIMSAISET